MNRKMIAKELVKLAKLMMAAPAAKLTIYSRAFMDTTEDDFEQGEIGHGQQVWNESRKGAFGSIKEVIAYYARTINCPTDDKSWYIYDGEDGRIECQWTVDENNYAADKQQIAAWKKGNMKLWSARLTVFVKFSRGEYVPDAKELKSVSGLQVS